MPDPPRRRRSATPPRRAARGLGVLPTIALGVGVVVAGLGIGAFLSALQRNTGSTPLPAATSGLPRVTPVARSTRGPIAMATIVSHATPSPSPRASATPHPTPSGSAQPTASASARPTSSPTASATPTATPRATTTPTPAIAARPTPRPTAKPAASAKPAATESGHALPTRATPLAATFASQAESTVRRYLDALIAGNEAGAYAAFGTNAGDPSVRLSEEAFIDRGTHIVSLRSTRADATGATVEAELSSARGSYFATYHVSSGPAGAVIDQHDYIRE